jgi:GTPase SAR1 family protein
LSEPKSSKEISGKIAILGLANAGKTSIIKVLTQEFDMLTSLRPTQNIERSYIEILGRQLVFWDFGGQEIYRSKYLTSPQRYFDEVSDAYYVIDSQDPGVIDENIQYFLTVYENLRKYSPNANLILLFHKDDPSDSEVLDKYNLKQKIMEGIVPTLEKANASILIYRTSVYNHLSIITAFSQPILLKRDSSSAISAMLRSVVEMYNLGCAILFSRSFLDIGNAINQRMTVNDQNFLLQQMMKTYKPDIEGVVEIANSEKSSFRLLIVNFSMNVGVHKIPFFLVFAYDDESILERDGFEIAMKRLNDNFSKMLSNMDLFSYLGSNEQ